MLKGIGFVTGILVLALTAQAEGKRAFVMLKSASGSGTVVMSKANIAAVVQDLKQNNFQVQSTLNNLQSVVVKIESEEQLQQLRQNPFVAYVDMEVMFPAPKPTLGKVYFHQLTNISLLGSSAKNKTPWGIHAVNAKPAWNVAQRGANTRVMVLDSGIDKDHPSLKSNFEKGQDFVQDSNLPYPYADSIGHGTHVAGTIAAKEDSTGFTGVAPAAKILMGRVCSDMGCSSVAIAEGIDWAITEKVDLINMSLGGAMSPPSVRDAIVRAEQAGIVVVAAAGNSGEGKVGYPAALPTVVAVGAVDVGLKKANFSQYGPELDIAAPGVDVVSAVPMGSGRDSIVTVKTSAGEEEILNAPVQGAGDINGVLEGTAVHAGFGSKEEIAKVNMKGKIALLARGQITFTEKVINAMKAGASAVVVYNNEPGIIRGGIQPPEPVTIPVVIIEQTVGLEMKAELEANKPVKIAMKMATTDFASFDGTSMASPHVAGVVALIKSTNKSMTPAAVRSLLKRTAKALGPNQNNEFGAGLVDAAAAVHEASKAAHIRGLR